MGHQLAKQIELSGWGKYPIQKCFALRPERPADVKNILIEQSYKNYIAFGLGRSYGDTPLNDNSGVVLTHELNKYITFDPDTGVLECEAGVTFEEIINTFLPRGYFLPVTPGTKYITVGGAVANDVHGKNHHVDGCFSEHVLELKLMLASGVIINCSREQNADIYWATVGGIGLTGLIISVRFRLIRVESAFYDVRYEKARNIDKALELFSESDDKYQYSVAWIDCLAKGSSLGRCVLMRGNHATQEQVRGSNLYRIHSKPKLNVPINLPSFILNNMSIKLFNQAYYQFNPSGKDLIVHYNPFFYPLDSINNWNRMYGRKGFVQYQAVFPPETSRQGLIKMLERLSNTKRSSFLAVLKSSGAENNGLLSFPRKGYTLALDIPIKDQTLFPFINNLDELVANHGGRVYLAKDSTLSINDFEVMYPKIKKFKEIKNKVDPNQLFASSMSRRLGITEA